MEGTFAKIKGNSELVTPRAAEFSCPHLAISQVIKEIVKSFLLFLVIKTEQNRMETPLRDNDYKSEAKDEKNQIEVAAI